MAVTERDGAETEERPQRSGAGGGRTRGRIASTVSVLGELLITAGLVMALFVAYSLWWTNVLADRAAGQESAELRDQWAAERDSGGPDADAGPGELDVRNGIGFLHVPAMSDDDILVMPGTDPEELNQGVAGFYEKPVKSAMPWDESGNFSLAAHRDGHGAKFHDIHEIEKGDPIVFESKDTWYVYTVYAVLPETSKYNVQVLADVPRESGKEEEGRYITLTTCTPVFTSTYRYIVWGELERTVPVDADRTPPEELRAS
ncbi:MULTISPECIES: class E sortase [Streptomyces]|uniref:class E sortase n=1 Tax=Streptomyces TaxID=1883 RepID=UPI002B05DF2C|nr:class E sortase [Streptomyces sp. JHD 1]